MHFTTLQFALFFLVVLTVNWLLKGRGRSYKIFLAAANLFFYGSLAPGFLVLLVGVATANWASGRLTTRIQKPAWRKLVLAINVILNLGSLAFFKYFEFFSTWAEYLFMEAGLNITWSIPEIIFPIGISFFTFQGLSYSIDAYRDRGQTVDSYLDVLLFVSFFPTVLSGPIMRARDFIPQLYRTGHDPRRFQEGFALILSGLFKKVVIASYLSEHIVRQVFQVPENYSSVAVLAAIYAYSIQIYCDFSGYTDLALGIGRLLGYRLPDNFLSPYRAVNMQDFWRRWHISLSTWLRDYLYISLGGNRRGSGRKYVNLMITMVLGGLWHGAHSRFIIWGALHGLGLVITHIYQDLMRRLHGSRRNREPGRAGKFISWLATFNVVSFLWVFFRAEDSHRAWEVFRAVFFWNQAGAGFEFWVLPAVAIGLGMQWFGTALREGYIRVQEHTPLVGQAVITAVLVVIILRLGPEGVLPFIYFQF